MTPFLVRCLLWLLMAALPLQGSAAVFATCKSQAPSASHGCHEQGAMAMHDAALAEDGGDGKAALKAHGKCSTCASCCTAATAPPLAVRMPAPFPRPGRALPTAEPCIAAIFPPGLERPPRPM